MSSKQDKKRYDKAVKPYFYPAKDCYIIYSSDGPSRKLSKKSSFEILVPKQLEEKFDFKLLCDNLSESVYQAEEYHKARNLPTMFPISLGSVESYSIETNTLKLFILHKISANSGFGISTYSALPKARIIAEYVGERKDYYSLSKFSDNTYVFRSDDGTKVDAKDYGNVARFFNHCPNEHANPNVLTANLMVLPWKSSDKLTKHFFITLRDVKAFEPLCWDYGDTYDFGNEVELLDAKTYLPLSGNIDNSFSKDVLFNNEL